MDIKEIVKNPDLAFQALSSPPESTFLEKVAALKAITAKCKGLQNEKKLCSKDFKLYKDDPEGLSQLKAKMQEISSALKNQSQQRVALEKELTSLFEKKQKPLLPNQFLPCQQTHSGEFEIVRVTDQQAQQWDTYVANHPKASLYHQYRWKGIIEDSFSQQSYYLAAFDQSQAIVGILPTVHLSSWLFGSYGVSMPFFNYGGPLANSPEIAVKLVESASAFAKSENWKHLEVRTTDKTLPWPSREDKVAMIRALPASEEALEKELGAKVRAQINLAKKHTPETAIGHSELLDEFYAVFSTNMRDLGTPVYGKHFFRNILNNCPNDSHIVILRLNGKAVATAFLLQHKHCMEIPWASTLNSVNSMNMNMYLYREVLGLSIRKKVSYFDFGRSSKDSGTFRFKKQWKAIPVENYWYYPTSEVNSLPALNPNNPKFILLIAIWKRLPVWVTRLIGPSIIKNLP